MPQNKNAILFTSNRSKFKDDELLLTLEGEPIAQTTSVKYLSLYIDTHMNFDLHVKKLCCKINVHTKLMWRVRHFISQDLALTLYHSLIEPHFVYCSFIIEGMTQCNLKKLQIRIA